MIALETESLTGLYDPESPYDNLFGFLKKSEDKKEKYGRSEEEREARKQRRKNTISDIDNAIRENGGIDGIADSLGNVIGMFKNKSGYQAPSDFQVGLGHQVRPHKNPYIGVYIVGGLLAASLVTFGIITYNKYRSFQ